MLVQVIIALADQLGYRATAREQALVDYKWYTITIHNGHECTVVHLEEGTKVTIYEHTAEHGNYPFRLDLSDPDSLDKLERFLKHVLGEPCSSTA